MGAALYIALEQEVTEVENFVDGKALSRSEGELAKLAHQLGVRPLMDFFSMSAEEFEEQAQQFNTNAGITDPTPYREEWFTAEEGLATIRAFIGHLQTNPDTLPTTQSVLSDLEDFADVLEEAGKRGIRWHLCVDY